MVLFRIFDSVFYGVCGAHSFGKKSHLTIPTVPTDFNRSSPKLMNPITPKISVIKMYTSFEDVYVRQSKGFFTNWRWGCVLLTQLVFYGLPWISWNNRQALLFDLAARKFYIFGVVLLPQDFIYLALFLIICAYMLFLLTAVVGRVWCGFSCPQTVYTEIFMWVERKIEGDRSARKRLDKQKLSLSKLTKKTAKHLIWAGIGLWTGFSFVGYFTPIATLFDAASSFSLGPWDSFWIVFYAGATYGNAGWMREQICRYLCPYARFQSAMFDKDTLIVSYDKQRGEPRTPLDKTIADANTTGSCIDCSMCVQVCPTGIDIRNGLQHDCIGCAACVDACDMVMGKIGAPLGLVRFTTENALANNFSGQEIKRRLLRPRVLIYSSILAAVLLVFFSSLATHIPLKFNVIRDRGNMMREVEFGAVENIYRLHVMSADEKSHSYKISVSGIQGIQVTSRDVINLSATSEQTIPVTVKIDRGAAKVGNNKISFKLQALDDQDLFISEKASFFVAP
jgi:cytochrome c oxidase accessory protein FixG